jgi:plastocyanin
MRLKKLLLLATAVAVTAAAFAVPALAASTKSVKVGDDYFVKNGTKPTVTVKAGTTVKWVWGGHAPHDVRVVSGPAKFASSVQVKGTFSKKLTKKGTYKLICTIHQPSMAMTLKVT